MTSHHTLDISRRAGAAWRVAACVGLLGLSLLAGCGSLLPKPQPTPSLFVLDDAGSATTSAPRPGAAAAATLIVNAPRATAAFDTTHIVYLRHAHEIEYFAHNQWADTPAQMLAPLIVHRLERSGAFRAVVHGPSSVAADLRLDTELVRLQHEFTGTSSRVRLTLRAVLVDAATRRVLAWREFDASVAAPSNDPQGGVMAANQAVQNVLSDLAAFCAENALR